jgi:acetyltransferase-like isoleucine patch superfamily enzyme
MARYSIPNLLGDFRLWLCNHVVNKIPSHHLRLWFYRTIMKFKIGPNSYIHLGCHFNCKDHFLLGENSVINQYCHIDNRGGIYIGNNVSIAPDSKLITADHDLYSSDCAGRSNPIHIEDYCFIGYGAIILSPSYMEIGSALGAHSLLKGRSEAYYIYLGLPAKKGKKRPEVLNYTMNYDRLFH